MSLDDIAVDEATDDVDPGEAMGTEPVVETS
jgi:hypothetical protein